MVTSTEAKPIPLENIPTKKPGSILEVPVLSAKPQEFHKPIPDVRPSIVLSTEQPVQISTEKPVFQALIQQQPNQDLAQESLDKIPVFVQPIGFLKDSSNEKKGETPVTNVSIVPSEDMGQETNNDNQSAPLGEIMYYRKCAQGYARDKRGRCRKVRRPQFP